MKNLVSICSIAAAGLLFFGCGADAKKQSSSVLEGHYRGKNLFVQNPFGPEGVGFCIIEVKINGQITADEVNTSAFEIDFKHLGIKEGDPIKVELIHKKDCEPKILNPEVLE